MPAPSCGSRAPRSSRRSGTSRSSYGDGLIKLALDILTKKAVPPAVFVHHQVITRENVDHYYPNDALLGVSTYAGY